MEKENEKSTAIPSEIEADVEKFEDLFKKWNDKLCQLAEYKLRGKGSYHDAIEIVQDAWHDYLIALRSGKQIDEPGRWLFRVVSNKTANQLNALIAERQAVSYIEESEIDFDKDGRFAEEDDYSSLMGTTEIEIDYYELKNTILPQLLEKLSKTDRALFEDYFFENMHISELAVKYNIEANAMSQRLFRVKMRLRKAYDKYMLAHPPQVE